MREVDIIVTFTGYVPDDMSDAEVLEVAENEIPEDILIKDAEEVGEEQCFCSRLHLEATSKPYSIIYG